VAEDEKEKV